MVKKSVKRSDRFLEVQLAGGIGNQLFQYCGLLATAKILNRPPRMIEQGPYDHKKMHGYSLAKLAVPIPIRTRLFENSKLLSVCWRIDRWIIARNKGFSHFRRVYQFDNDASKLTSTDLDQFNELRGYFQSWEYVKPYVSHIRDLLKQSDRKPVLDLISRLETSNVMALHARRGDYKSNVQEHGLLSVEYYLAASKQLLKRSSFDEIWIFSDDQEFSEKIAICLAPLISQTVVVDQGTLEVSEVIDLMSRCAGQVISNSTFSWWGAALANDPERVIAPYPWSRNGRENSQIYDSNWGMEASIWE